MRLDILHRRVLSKEIRLTLNLSTVLPVYIRTNNIYLYRTDATIWKESG